MSTAQIDVAQPGSAMVRRRFSWWAAVGLLLVLGLAAGVRWRLLDVPLERDEGEYAYMGQRILQGVPPYRESANMKWPGTYLAYALIQAVGGETVRAIHVGGLLVNLCSSLLIFQLARRRLGETGAVVAAGSHAWLSLLPPTLGLAAHATHFVMVWALAGLVLLTGGEVLTRWRCVLAGACFAVAVLMKQSGALFGLLGGGWLVWRVWSEERNWREVARCVALFGVGGLAPLAVVAAWLGFSGVWESFWNWTIVYAREYATIVTQELALHELKSILWRFWLAAPGMWCLAGAGLVAVWWRPGWRWLLSSFFLISAASVCPAWFFRGHYFLLLMPAVALAIGTAGQVMHEAVGRTRWLGWLRPVVWLSFAVAAGHMVWQAREMFFRLTPEQVSRTIYPGNPFVEAVEIGRYLRERTRPEARITILGSEPEILFYAQRRNATDFLYTYPLLEPHRFAPAMQRQFVEQVEAADADYLVFVYQIYSWLPWQPGTPEIFQWIGEYGAERFHPVGVIEFHPDGSSETTWLEEGRMRRPLRTPTWILVMRNNRLLGQP